MSSSSAVRVNRPVVFIVDNLEETRGSVCLRIFFILKRQIDVLQSCFLGRRTCTWISVTAEIKNCLDPEVRPTVDSYRLQAGAPR